MLHELLSEYLESVDKAAHGLRSVHIERYEEEIFSPNRMNVRIRIRFFNGYLLELNEAVIIESENLRHLGYRYHFQDYENSLVFRYDDTPHYPRLASFPHHKHGKSDVTASVKPSIVEAINEAKSLIESLTT